MKYLSGALFAIVALGLGQPGLAQNYPAKPIRIIVHFPPGGPTDMVARTIGQKMTESWGQQVIVENRPGAGGVIGVETVLRAPHDGYTLLFATGGSMSIAPAIGIKAPYNVFTDLAPITLLVINPQILVLHPSVPANSVASLIKLAKAKPGAINYASVGPGSPQHLGTELLKHLTGVDMVHIPYKGTAPAVTDILAGHVSLMFNSMPTVLPMVKAGRLKGLAVSSAKRSPAAPDIPTVGETVPGFQYVTWYGMFVPAAVPKDIVARLNTEIVRILKLKDVGERFASQGAEPAPGAPGDLAQFMKAEYEQWRKTIAAAKLTLN
jgi:tripartite-type tricarboxylate transporter receptor subunit TctC